jgi:type I restriction enzyme S subunit
MSTGLKPYPVMKDSGIEWLGEVPKHWKVVPNRALFDEIKDRNCPDEEMLSVTIKKGVIRQTALLKDSSKKDNSNLDRSNYKLVQPGDIAYNKMRAWQGAIGVSAFRGIISPAYVVQRSRNFVEPGYFHQLFRIPSFAKEAEHWSYGITSDMWSLRPEHFKLIYSCLPPIAEQAAIVRYLDYVDRRVRRLVRAKRKLIALLAEKKQAIIHRAVTRGLDPDMPLKNSGIEWLREVPAHWEVVRSNHLMQLTTGFPFKSEGFSQSEDDIRLLRGVNVSPGSLRWSDTVYWPITERAAFKNFELLLGDIVLGMDRPIISTGIRVAQVTEKDLPCLLLQRVARIRPLQVVHAQFLFHLLAGQSFKDYLTPIFTGVSVPHLSPDQIHSFRVAFPPLDEQVAIIKHLSKASTDIDTAITHANREIGLLNEYCTRLIADVVTGKIDVRKAATTLPDVDPLAAEDAPGNAIGQSAKAGEVEP